MNPLALLGLLWQNRVIIAALAAGVMLFGAGWTVNEWRWKAKEADAHTQANYRATGLEIQLELLQRKARETNRRYANEVRKDAYRCPIPADGASLLNDARRPSKPDR